MKAMIKTLPMSPVFWSPDQVASYLDSISFRPLADAVMGTVRLHSFNEVDGPRLLRRDGKERLQELGARPSEAQQIIAGLHQMEEQAVIQDGTCSLPALNLPLPERDEISLRSRMSASLWGIFVGDALAMPAHWYYDTSALDKDYGNITGYVAPKTGHSANGIMNNHWESNKHNVRGLIEGGLMCQGKGQNWATRFTHYHAGMQAGENTLNAHCARVLIRTLIDMNGTYDSKTFLSRYKTFLMTPNSHNDSYAEAFHRQIMDNHMFKGLQLEDSAGAENHDTPSIGGFVMLPPVILAGIASGNASASVELAERHLMLTHRSERLAANAKVYAELVIELSRGASARDAIGKAGRRIGIDLEALLAMKLSNRDVAARVFGPACYISDSFPVALYLAYKYSDDFRGALLANVNLGGECCHRGSALGAIVGAAVGLEGIPDELIKGLYASIELNSEITSMVDSVLKHGRSMEDTVRTARI